MNLKDYELLHNVLGTIQDPRTGIWQTLVHQHLTTNHFIIKCPKLTHIQKVLFITGPSWISNYFYFDHYALIFNLFSLDHMVFLTFLHSIMGYFWPSCCLSSSINLFAVENTWPTRIRLCLLQKISSWRTNLKFVLVSFFLSKPEKKISFSAKFEINWSSRFL